MLGDDEPDPPEPPEPDAGGPGRRRPADDGLGRWLDDEAPARLPRPAGRRAGDGLAGADATSSAAGSRPATVGRRRRRTGRGCSPSAAPGAGEAGQAQPGGHRDGPADRRRDPAARGPIHLVETIRAAAPHQRARGRTTGRLRFRAEDLRVATREGHESNLVLFCVDASGSMAARKRMEQVKTAILSLLLDAYQRRDKVGLVTFRGERRRARAAADALGRHRRGPARRTCPPAAVRRSPRACSRPPGCSSVERVRDPRRRPLLVVVTDGRATAGRRRRSSARGAAAALLAGRRRRQRWSSTARAGRSGSGWPAVLAEHLRRRARAGRRGQRRRARPRAVHGAGGLMPQGQPLVVPDDGLTTRAAPQPAAADGAHRRRQGEVDRRLRAGAARLEPGLERSGSSSS